ncbi:SMI1 / KNR4 family (SUKH-1) [Paenibacillaceae bacterium GAS479]|nr:SMI1 / KNR4 family (SUKH-1) [Paenibacillaceae bacterium GAS479]
MKNDLLNDTLQALKNRLSHNGTLKVQVTGGYMYEGTCSFGEGASNDQINEFTQFTRWNLPPDYLDFLILHNGAKLFADPYGSYVHLLSLSEIMQYHKDSFPDNHFVVAMAMDGYLLVDCNRITSSPSDYLVWFEAGSFYDLKMNFTCWLDRLIVAQGEKYWTWNVHLWE